MPDNDPKELFTNLPTHVSFSLNPQKQSPHGLCWFTSMEGSLIDVDTLWRETFAASEDVLPKNKDSE